MKTTLVSKEPSPHKKTRFTIGLLLNPDTDESLTQTQLYLKHWLVSVVIVNFALGNATTLILLPLTIHCELFVNVIFKEG